MSFYNKSVYSIYMLYILCVDIVTMAYIYIVAMAYNFYSSYRTFNPSSRLPHLPLHADDALRHYSLQTQEQVQARCTCVPQ